MARMTDKKVREIWSWTQECYEQAFKSMHPIMEHLLVADKIPFEELRSEARFMEIDGAPWDPSEVRQKISREYERLVCQLPTYKLQLILEANDKGKIRRAPVTINQITTELLERQLRGETPQPEPKAVKPKKAKS